MYLNIIVKNKKVKIISFNNLAQKIDKNIKNLCILQHFFDKKLKKYANMNISNVVLGCTHYNLIKKQIINSLTKNPLVKNQKKYQILDAKKVLKTNKIFKVNYDKNLAVKVKILTLKNSAIKFYEGSKILAKRQRIVTLAIMIWQKNVQKF